MPTVEAQVHIENTNPEEAFDALVEPLLVQFWFPFEFMLDPKVGGSWSFQRDAWDRPASGVIEAMEPGVMLRLRFTGAMRGLVNITVQREGKGVRIALRHDDSGDEAEALNVWTMGLERLKDYLEAQTP